MKKNICLIIGFIVLVILLILLAMTYGLFETKTKRTASSDVAAWVIDVNGTDIVTHETFNVDDFVWENNINVKEGKIAPGVGGYFDIVIDPSTSQVSVRYDISFDFTELSDLDFTYDIVGINGSSLTRVGESTYAGVIPLSDIANHETRTIRCNITWNNNEEKNSEDSEIGQEGSDGIIIPVEVKATQYLGETITAYEEND